MDGTTTWREKITEAMGDEDNWDNVEACTLSQAELDVKFYAGYGGEEGVPFTLWTKTRVYFPGCYDGSKWCASVSRHPDGAPTPHVGR